MATTAQYGAALYGDSYYGLLVLNCANGSYSVTGGDAALLYRQSIQGEAGSYALTGNDANFLYDQVVQGNSGAYTLTGSDATLDYDQILNAEAGAFTLTGNDCTFLYDQTIYAGAFSFIWSGQQAGTVKDSLLVAEPGAYSITGGSAELLHKRIITGNHGSFMYTGKSADLEYSGTPVIIVESKGGVGKKKRTKIDAEREQREQLEAIVKREFDILDGTYEPEIIETVKSAIEPQISQIDYTQYAIALAQVNALLLQAKIQAAEYQAELDDEEALLMLL